MLVNYMGRLVKEHQRITDCAIKLKSRADNGDLKARKDYINICREQQATHSEMMKDSRQIG